MTSRVGSAFGVLLLACLASAPSRAEDGWVEWQAWAKVNAGADARALPADSVFKNEPQRWNRVTRFESARDLMENFAVRMRGRFVAPEDGEYRFKLEVQGAAVLRLSQADAAAGKTVELVYARDGAASSAPVKLNAGRAYWLEAIHHGAEGPDALRVGWLLPDGTEEMPVPASRFAASGDATAIAAFNLRKAVVEPYTRGYDPVAGLSRDRHAPKTNEHLTRETFYAAGAMLEDGRAEQVAEAIRAMEKVLPLQDMSERSGSFGNWPKVVEKPDNFNAQNIGGFIGEEIILILTRHREKLPAELVEKLEAALRRAAIRGVRYDPPVTATNIVTKAVTVGLLADQMLGLPEVREWAAERLRELHAHTQEVGLPTEYNSATYNSVAMKALGLLRAELKDPELRALVEDLYRATWREVALNYNPHLQLWTGPAARRYDDVFTPGALLQLGTGNRLFFGENAFSLVEQDMPAEFAADFERREGVVTRTFPVLAARPTARIEDQQSPVELTATVHHAPAFSIGSFNRADLWDQRRPLIAFWGRRDAPGYFRVSSPSGKAGLLAAQTHSVQEGGTVATAVSFATDAGWGANPYDLHQVNRRAPIQVSEVRIRFEVGGPAGGGALKAPYSLTAPVVRKIPGGRLELRVLHARFGDYVPRWETTKAGHLDLVLHDGGPVELGKLAEAAVAFSVTVAADGAPTPATTVRLGDGRLRVTLGEQTVSVPVRPASYATLQSETRFTAPIPASLISAGTSN